MRKLIKSIVVTTNLLAGLLLVPAYLARLISPQYIEFIHVFALGYFYSLVLNILFIVFWIVKKSKWAFLSTALILIGWINLQLSFQYNISRESDKAIKLLSYNVRAFDRFDWTGQKGSKKNIIDFVTKEQPEIICYQEFFSKSKKGLSTFDTLLLLQKAKNHHLAYYKQAGKLNLSGVATFSVYPIVNKGKLELEESIVAIFSDMRVNNDTLRVYNTHLQSVHFGYDNYTFIDNIKDADEDKMMTGMKNIYKKLLKGYSKRAKQAEFLQKHIKKCKYRKIVCGDFNDASTSYTYRNIRGNLNDAFVSAGKGFGFSYVRGLLNFRIDFIFYSSGIVPLRFKTEHLKYSDHYPLLFEFEF